MCGNYSREETIQGRKLYEEIRYIEGPETCGKYIRLDGLLIHEGYKNHDNKHNY